MEEKEFLNDDFSTEFGEFPDDVELEDLDDVFDPTLLDLFTTSYNFNEVFSSMEQYQKVENEVKKELMENYARRKDDAAIILDNKRFEMSVGKLFLNLLLMRPFAEIGVIPNEDDIFDGNTVSQDVLDEYFNHIVERFRNNGINVDYDKIRTAICKAMDEMCDLSGEYNVKVGNSVSYRDLIRLEVEDPEFDALTHTKVKPGQFHDIEKQFNELGKKLMNYFIEHKDTELHPFVASETGINKKQFTQAIGFVGLKPTMSGEVIPVTVKDNFLRGLNSLESYYINASGKSISAGIKSLKKAGSLKW